MKQQINLYQGTVRREPQRFAGKTLLISITVLLGSTLILSGFGLWQLKNVQDRSRNVALQLADSRLKLAAVAEELAAKQPDGALTQQVARLEQLIKHRQHLRSVLQADLFNNGEGYSRYLIALARQHVRGMWLTSVSITGAGSDFTLQGATLEPDLVPRYLRNLSRETLLQGQEFRSFQLSRPPADGNKPAQGPMDFVVATSFQEGT